MAQYDVNKAVFTGEHLRDNLCECVTARCAREIAYIIHSNLECSPAIVVLLPTPTAVAGVRFSPLFVCVSVSQFFCTIYQQPIQLGSRNITQRCSTMSPGKSFILRSKGRRSRSRVVKTLPAWVFALQWVLAASSFRCIKINTSPRPINHVTSP